MSESNANQPQELEQTNQAEVELVTRPASTAVNTGVTPTDAPQPVEPAASGSAAETKGKMPQTGHCRIFFNPKSGGKEVTDLIEILRKGGREFLPTMCNLNDSNYRVMPELFARWAQEQTQGESLDNRVVVAGGDGTVNWILHEMARYSWRVPPSVALFPMGTGNDAARYFGYGARLGDANQVLSDLRYVFGDRDELAHARWDRWNLFVLNPNGRGPKHDKLFDRPSIQITADQFLAATRGEHPYVDYKQPVAQVSSSIVNPNAIETNVAQTPESTGLPPPTIVDQTEIQNSVPSPSDESKEFAASKQESQEAEAKSSGKDTDEHSTSSASASPLAPSASTSSASDANSEILEGNSQPVSQVAVSSPLPPEANSSVGYYHMTFYNYFSIGIDAQTMHSLEVNRTECAGCHKCRCCTMTCIGLLNARDCICCRNPDVKITVDFLVPKSHLRDFVASPHDRPAGTESEFHGEEFSEEYVWVPQSHISTMGGNAFVLTNLPNYAAGRTAWGRTEDVRKGKDLVSWSKPQTSDGRLEFSMFDGYNHLASMTMCGVRAHRLGVVEGVRFNLRGTIYAQFDGEAWKQDKGTILVLRGKPVDIIRGKTEVTCC